MSKSPTATRMLKYSFNAIDDGLVGQQLFAGETTRLAYMTDEAVEGRDQFLEKRDPDWSPVPLVLLRRTASRDREQQEGRTPDLAETDLLGIRRYCGTRAPSRGPTEVTARPGVDPRWSSVAEPTSAPCEYGPGLVVVVGFSA